MMVIPVVSGRSPQCVARLGANKSGYCANERTLFTKLKPPLSICARLPICGVSSRGKSPADGGRQKGGARGVKGTLFVTISCHRPWAALGVRVSGHPPGAECGVAKRTRANGAELGRESG